MHQRAKFAFAENGNSRDSATAGGPKESGANKSSEIVKENEEPEHIWSHRE